MNPAIVVPATLTVLGLVYTVVKDAWFGLARKRAVALRDARIAEAAPDRPPFVRDAFERTTHEISLHLNWRLRENSTLLPDTTEDEGVLYIPVWQKDKTDLQNIGNNPGGGTFFVEQVSFSAYDYTTGKIFNNSEKFQMNRYTCPKRTTSLCRFK